MTARIWFISDTHFGHAKVERERGVEGACIVDRINAVVGVRDTLYHLGDFAWGGEKDWNRWRALIACRDIRLVPGNHDHRVKRSKIDGITWLEPLVIVGRGEGLSKAVLCHYPLEVWPQRHYGFLHFHGHCHHGCSTVPGRYNLCPEVVGYDPWSGPLTPSAA